MRTTPFSFDIGLAADWASQFDRRIERRLSALAGQYSDARAYSELRSRGDRVVYEVYEILRPEKCGELLNGLSIVHPGKVGDEFFMTKGHFHCVRDTAEIYLGLRGRGLLLMENESGDWGAEEFHPGRVVYVPPGWAHRSVNLDPETDLITFFVYPGHAGHDYGTIETQGFRKLVVQSGDGYRLVDNPAWMECTAREQGVNLGV